MSFSSKVIPSWGTTRGNSGIDGHSRKDSRIQATRKGSCRDSLKLATGDERIPAKVAPSISSVRVVMYSGCWSRFRNSLLSASATVAEPPSLDVIQLVSDCFCWRGSYIANNTSALTFSGLMMDPSAFFAAINLFEKVSWVHNLAKLCKISYLYMRSPFSAFSGASRPTWSLYHSSRS